MKLGFNEATALECKGQSLMADLEMCEKYGFDYIEIRFDCVKDYLKEHTLEELADWFKNHHLKPWAYNTLIFFNQRDEAGEKEAPLPAHREPQVLRSRSWLFHIWNESCR